MATIEENSPLHEEMRVWRHWLHQHPELAFQEYSSSEYIVKILESLGYTPETGWATTGVVATLEGEEEGDHIALRADIDALPILEKNKLPYKSLNKGKMHACGHDGHTSMLLGAAAYLKQNRQFKGTVHFIFQPAEEGFGGARVMLEEGLFDRFPCKAVYGMHNWPSLPVGEFVVHQKEVMAATDAFSITVKGKGGHAAMPNETIDPVVISAQVINALQTIVSRNVSPLDSVVISVTQIHAGSATNIIPDDVALSGTLRYFDNKKSKQVKKRMKRIVKQVCKSMGAKGKLRFELGYPATINTPEKTADCILAAKAVAGDHAVHCDRPPSMGAEDFSYLLNACGGVYIWIGNGEGKGGCLLHNNHYDFNDDVLPLGASYWVALVKQLLPLSGTLDHDPC
ncbi:MAG: amidohydrolase [Cocleimonas sp.]|nr:amidohydrolase [Cocleimonas sp.]